MVYRCQLVHLINFRLSGMAQFLALETNQLVLPVINCVLFELCAVLNTLSLDKVELYFWVQKLLGLPITCWIPIIILFSISTYYGLISISAFELSIFIDLTKINLLCLIVFYLFHFIACILSMPKYLKFRKAFWDWLNLLRETFVDLLQYVTVCKKFLIIAWSISIE
jgi:hypothetical protein